MKFMDWIENYLVIETEVKTIKKYRASYGGDVKTLKDFDANKITTNDYEIETSSSSSTTLHCTLDNIIFITSDFLFDHWERYHHYDTYYLVNGEYKEYDRDIAMQLAKVLSYSRNMSIKVEKMLFGNLNLETIIPKPY